MLRVWREQAGYTLSDLASQLHLATSTLSRWETGKRGRHADSALGRVEQLARLLNDDEVLVDLWQAAGTPEGLPARADWAYNPPMGGPPVWAWIRTQSLEVDSQVSLWWGEALQGHAVVPAGGNGLLVQFPASATNPALQVSFHGPDGWVDFGRGRMPHAAVAPLGMKLVDGRRLLYGGHTVESPMSAADFDADHHRLTGYVLAASKTRLGIAWHLIEPYIGALRPRNAVHPLDRAALEVFPTPGHAVRGEDQRFLRQLNLFGDQLKRLRVARGMSREVVEAKAARLGDMPQISAKAVEKLEQGAQVKDHGVIAKLDTIYRADGRLGIERVVDFGPQSRPRDEAIFFPEYYVGPIWLMAEGPEPESVEVLVLTWGGWRKHQPVRSGTLLTTRKAYPNSHPMFIRTPSGWRVTAGTGAVANAIDINRRWYPKSVAIGIRLLQEGVLAIERALR